MSTQQNILAIIPARSGSKTLKDKNILSFQGKPMLVHSIEHAKQSSLINRVIVSTDSEEYAQIAKDAGADVPFLRPAEFAQDDSTDLEVFDHALRWLKEEENYESEICVHLRPTYPIRNISDIDAAIQILMDKPEIDSVRSITKTHHPPYKMWFMNDDNILSPVIDSDIRDPYNIPRQSLPVTYLQNANIDVTRTSTILEKDSMTGDVIYGYEMEHCFDVDTQNDFDLAEKAAPIHPGKEKTYCFDIDGVIATIVPNNDYALAKPIEKMIDKIRTLHKEGNRIILFTARGTMTGIDWREVTEKQLKDWNVPYDELRFGKPAADFYIDDRTLPVESLYSDIS